MEEKNIVAIDLGTSKIALTVAKVNGNDVQIAYYKEMPSAGIKYSSVWNINQATDPLSRIIRDAGGDRGLQRLAFFGQRHQGGKSVRLAFGAVSYGAL